MQIYDYKQLYNEYLNKVNLICSKLEYVDKEIKRLNCEQELPEVWADVSRATEINKSLKLLTGKKDKLSALKIALSDFEVAIELAESDPQNFAEEDLETALSQVQNLLNILWIETLLAGEYDSGSAVISLHAGAGGEEAQDWAEMLARMYVRYSNLNGYKVTLLDTTAGDGAGIKSQTFLIEGEYAYGYLKTEKGVHRLVRLSPFDANNRRHTSFASLEVAPFVDKQTQTIEINPNEIKVDTFRSSGAGGQHVNKTESAIRITHLPTGIVVTCQNERSQIQNREMAMKLLVSKLTEKNLAEQEEERLKKLAQNKKIEWGSQIRSYVLHPYTLIKDHRTNYETGNAQAVLDGEIQAFINEYLKVIGNE